MTISPDAFNDLAKLRNDAAVSIYLPTHAAGREEREDRIRLKNLVSAAESQAGARGIDRSTLDVRLEPIRAILDDEAFWRDQRRGLAMLSGSDGVSTFRLPEPVEEMVYVGDRLALRPLLPFVTPEEPFYVLALGLKHARLIRRLHDEVELVSPNPLPDRYEDVVGYDHEQKSLQAHTGESSRGAEGDIVFHGQGSSSDEEQQRERDKYLRAIDDALNDYFRGRGRVVVLAGDEPLIDRFREISKHPRIAQQGVGGNPEHLTPEQLAEAALPVARPLIEADRIEKRDRVLGATHSDSVTADLKEILPALQDHRVATLLIDATTPTWGWFDPETKQTKLAPSGTDGADDLLSYAASEAATGGAEVYSAKMNGEHRVVAELRF